LITGLAWPFFTFLSLMAFPVMRILFGNGWDAAIPVARILCFSESVLALANLNFLLFQATGEVGRNLRVQLIIQPIAVALVLTAAQFDLFAITLAIISISIISVATSYHFVKPVIGVRYRDIAGASAKSLGLAAFTAIAPLAVLATMTVDGAHVWPPAIVSALGSAVGWLAGARLLKHPVQDEIANAFATLRRWLVTRDA
jgi:O-antigen/teichoic acid export membrane protein